MMTTTPQPSVGTQPKRQVIRYKAEKTLSKLHHDLKSFVRLVRGPIGSGKSVGCIQEVLKNAHEQAPAPDGIRYSRWAIIRNTYPELKTTTIKTWQDWVPEAVAPIKWSSPITCLLDKPLPDGTRVHMEVLFLALDKPEDTKKLLSLELTGVFINEAREIPKEVVDTATSRVGRYPPKRWGGPTRSCIVMDTNAPSDDHWWAELESNPPEGWTFYTQPGGLKKMEYDDGRVEYIPNPNAENINNLPSGYKYYLQMLGGKTAEWIKVYVLNEFGTIMQGKPVYGESWNSALHVAKQQIPIDPNYPVLLSWDFGLTPACIISQVVDGQWRVLHELCATDMGLRKFGMNTVLPWLRENLNIDGRRVEIGLSACDPAGVIRSDADEKTCMQVLNGPFIPPHMDPYNESGLGIPTVTSPSNALESRIDAVLYFLTRLTDKGQPAFIVNPNCKMLIAGFNGGYRFRKLNVSGDERHDTKPEKNKYSHPHDALQYGPQTYLFNAGIEYRQSASNTHYHERDTRNSVTGY